MKIILVAAEYAGAPALRCTPLADTVEQLANALSATGARVTVLTPSYDCVAGVELEPVNVAFGGDHSEVDVVSAGQSVHGVEHIALTHSRMAPQGPGKVYCDDGPDAPFATDASKFAFFAASCAAWISACDPLPDIVHVHDWPGALFFALREFDPQHLSLKTVRCVFSLHSLDVQGRRPLALHDSSLRSWFCDLPLPRRAVVDPRYDDCVNPVATALRLADRVALPSARFKNELCADETEDLATLLGALNKDQRLLAIDAGATPRATAPRRVTWKTLRAQLNDHQRHSIGHSLYVRSAHYLAHETLNALPAKRPPIIASLLGPFDDNQIALLQAPLRGTTSTLDAMLASLVGGERLIIVGQGEPDAEAFFTAAAARHTRLVYMQGPPADLATTVLGAADFHLVLPRTAPSAAPALAALNRGQPCLIHAVGGLVGVVEDDVNGWCVPRNASSRQVVAGFARACAAKRAGGKSFSALRQRAAATGTSWREVAQQHITRLYGATAP